MPFARLALPFLLLASVTVHADEPADEAKFLKESVDFFDQVSRANLPRKVDKVTTLNSVQLDPTKKMLYYRYAISSLRLDQMDLGARAKFAAEPIFVTSRAIGREEFVKVRPRLMPRSPIPRQ